MDRFFEDAESNTTSAFLESDRIALRPLMESDAEGNYPNWLNDQQVNYGNSHHRFPYDSVQAVEYIRSNRGKRDSIVLAIVDKATNLHIGNISLQSIDYISRSAEFAIILGEKSFWGKGIGREAASMLFHHGFTALNLRRISFGTISMNHSVKKMAEALGMQLEGVRRQAFFKDGAYYDLLEYGVLRNEFLELR